MSAIQTGAPIAGAKLSRRNLLEYLGYRVTLDMDDRSMLTGKLVSLGPSGNVILTDVERERLVKRQRNAKEPRWRRECLAGVIFVRGSSIVAVRYTASIISDKSVIDHLGDRDAHAPRAVQMANLSPAIPLR